MAIIEAVGAIDTTDQMENMSNRVVSIIRETIMRPTALSRDRTLLQANRVAFYVYIVLESRKNKFIWT